MVLLRNVRFLRIGATVLELSLIVLLAISAAHWTWNGLAAKSVAPLEAGVGSPRVDDASASVRGGLFGVARTGNTPGTDASSESAVKLLGVIAAGASGAGSAVFLLESGRRKAVEAGWQIEPGFVLKEVRPDYVVVARNGTIERIKLGRQVPPKY